MSKWPGSTAHNKPPDDDTMSVASSRMYSGLLKAPSRPHTPLSTKLRSLAGGSQSGQAAEPEPVLDEDPQIARFRQLYHQTEAQIASLFDSVGDVAPLQRKPRAPQIAQIPDIVTDAPSVPPPTSKKRKLDDDYEDYDDDEEEEEDGADSTSPLKEKSNKVQIVTDATSSSPVARPVSRIPSDSLKIPPKPQAPTQQEDAEDARKKLEAAKRAEIETVRTLSRTMFFTLENDRDAMLDQQRLDEAERRAEAEAEGHAHRQNAAAQQGTLSSANLGASSLTLKNLIAQIDKKRQKVSATDADIRALLSEVRKNRSKWASEDKVGQEELYEAAEKVLNELKAMTEHSTPFLNPVKKKDAPDYYNIIKQPMDLGSMTKKLKNLLYKSKKDFVDDLYQIWKNCLKFNSSPDHIFRKHALYMQKETDKLVPLIPEIVIRDRAEIEAEERRQQIASGEIEDGAEESDDEPIMASRGRKAPKKSAKKGTSSSARKSVPETTPLPETKPVINALSSVQNGFRAESEMDGSQGHSTPPPGTLTPGGGQGPGSVLGAGSEAPEMDLSGMPAAAPPVPEYEDEEYRLWKQKTKKDRAMLATARHKLFRGDKLNPDEDALLRTKSGMRRWQRFQQEAAARDAAQDGDETRTKAQGSLSEGLEAEEETMLPDYYDSLSAIPDLAPRLRWEQDSRGQVIDPSDEYLRLYPANQFTAIESQLTKKINANCTQLQETRKIVSKIGVVKQMQLQSQTYQNQFSKYQPEPFFEKDIEKHVVADDGPVIAPYVCKAALQRTVGKLLFQAGFEEYQPSALDAITDMAHDFFKRMCTTLAHYKHEQHVPLTVNAPADPLKQRPSMTNEEVILHTFNESGLSLADIDTYVREDTDRFSTKLVTMHERMKAHLADQLRPALTDDTAQGSGNFADGGEQYVGGDFAEDLGEDFFGFKELGLMQELGLDTLTVPFHILHGRLNAAANQNTTTAVDGEKTFKEPPRWPKVNVENVEDMVGIAKAFFRNKLSTSGDRPLTEDLELPPKQRPGYGRPRIPASGKIGGDLKTGASPQKKAPQKPAPKPAKKDDKDKDKKGKAGGTDKATNGVLDEAEPVPMMNGVHTNKDKNRDAPESAGPEPGDGSPEKKKPTLKAKNGEIVKKGDHGDSGDIDGGPVKANGSGNGEGAMMSPESL
jgi:transcriptional activator SPT7